MKLAVVVGHNERAQGAVRALDGVSEFDWNSDLAQLIQLHDPDNIRVFYRSPKGGYSAEIDRVYRETDEWDADVTVELHFNSSANASVQGCETLSSGTPNSLRLAQHLQPKICALLRNKNRGIKVVRRHERGGRSLWQGKAPAVLLEPYFGSNKNECLRADEAKDQLAEAIYRGVMQYAQGV